MEGSKITGKVEDKKEIKTKTGKVFWAFTVAGIDMSTWEKEIYDKFNKDDVVDVTYTVKGKYKNISMMMLSETQPTEGDEQSEEPITTAEKVNGDYLKVKTIVANDQDEFDEAINKFNSEHKVTHTQFRLATSSNGSAYQTIFAALLFYK